MRRIGESSSERLRRANPVRAEEVEGPDSERARKLFERIIAEPARRAKQARRRALWILIPAAVLLLGAASYALYHKVTEPSLVVCYQDASLEANRAGVPPATSGPVRVCQGLWQSGGAFFSPGHSPPALVACVLDNGAIGVFPEDGDPDACQELGLATFEPAHGDGTDAVAVLQNDLAPHFLDACVGSEQATELAQAALRRLGLTGWQTAVSAPFTDQAPCASLALDSSSQTVYLVPVAGPSAG
jgi:hypothetical protein